MSCELANLSGNTAVLSPVPSKNREKNKSDFHYQSYEYSMYSRTRTVRVQCVHVLREILLFPVVV